MAVFSVPDMSCDHCRTTITEALEAIDDGAEVDVDMDSREVEVRSTAGNAAVLKALQDAGYPAELRS